MAKKGVLRLLGAEVRKRRDALDLSQEDLAGKAGVHVNVIGRLERGVYNPTVLLLQAVATALGTNLSELFSSIGE